MPAPAKEGLNSINLSDYAINSNGISQAYYIPNFISIEEEEYLIRQINHAPKPKWKNLANRRLQVWGGDLTSSGKLLAQPLPDFLTKYPDIIGRLVSTGAFVKSKNKAPNHVIINEYHPNQGIMPHEDGPAYYPLVATISLGSHTVFHYYQYKSSETDDGEAEDQKQRQGQEQEREQEQEQGKGKETVMDKHKHKNRGRVIDTSKPILSLLLEPRSLVITTGQLYSEHLHGIDETEEDMFVPHPIFERELKEKTGGGEEEGDDDVKAGCACTCEEVGLCAGVYVANWRMVKDEGMVKVLRDGGTLRRETRVSLTCRDVENVLNRNLKSIRR